MELTPKTKIDDLLNEHPFLLDFFLAQSPKYKLLKNPLTRRTIGKVATLTQVAAVGGLSLDRLLADIASEIKAKTGQEVSISGDGAGAGAGKEPAKREGAARTTQPERSKEMQARQEILKGIIKDLHKGMDMAILKQRFHDLVKDVDPTEIAVMEQGLIDEGMPESEIKSLCDVHVQVFKESLEKEEAPEAPPGHPVHTFMLENRAAEEIMEQIASILDKICDSEEEEFFTQYRDDLRQLMERLTSIHLHYLRKENQLFPVLEAHDIKGPSQVMWAIHDDIRETIKTAKAQLDASQGPEALSTIRDAVQAIGDMIYKEEHILLPMSMEVLSDAEWQKVHLGEAEIGYAWITPGEGWISAEAFLPTLEKEAAGSVMLNLETGSLTPGQVNLILTHLPVELSFVDENDEVRYFTQMEHKIFPRSPGVIGRKVQNCHPPASLDKVQKILDEFRAGTRDVVDFWIQRNGKFIYITYFAVRDAGGTYKGTLEVVQDATDLRKLTGEKRLLDWE